MTFERNHAKAIIACDFFVVFTATFQLVYVFAILEVGIQSGRPTIILALALSLSIDANRDADPNFSPPPNG